MMPSGSDPTAGISVTSLAPGGRRVVLITGFEANDPPHRNASAVLVEALTEYLQELRRASGGAEVRTRIMPGDTMALSASLEAALDEQPWPTHLLLLGQAPGRNKVTLYSVHVRTRKLRTSEMPLISGSTRQSIFGFSRGRSIERIATNLRDFGTPDRHGNLPRDVPIAHGGPAAFHSTWPEQRRLTAALNAAGIPAAMSNDAGNHLCNQLLYLALCAAAKRGQPCAVTFVHVPVLPQQVIDEEPMTMRHPNCPCLPLPMLTEAVACLLRTTFSPNFL